MADFSSAAVAAAAVTAVLAAIGYIGRQVADLVVAAMRKNEADFAHLVELQSLLNGSGAVYRVQNDLTRNLEALVVRNHPEQSSSMGFDALFTRAYGQFMADEQEMHSIIRSMTENSVRPLNQAMSRWLETDRVYKVGARRGPVWQKLAIELRKLETHLSVWHSKYQVWIPDHPAHALVYMADEKQHGVGFPEDLEVVVNAAVAGHKMLPPLPSEQRQRQVTPSSIGPARVTESPSGKSPEGL